ncbi:hypothetical protein BH11GEM1_BH11GEM1_24260 [soil metagenome]
MRQFLVLTACALAGAMACTFDQQAIAVAPTQVVVHAVLDPGASQQEVLVERTLSGAVRISDSVRFDALDPINTGGGVPVVRAQVSITGPDGVFSGAEIVYSDHPVTYGAGRYILKTNTAGSRIRPGARYALSVRTPEGAVVTGTTVVPNAIPFSLAIGAPLLAFNRDRDTLAISWNAVPLARSYGVRTESPFGPNYIYTNETQVRFAGDIRNVFASDLQRLFIPGFRQTYTVFAIDTNYFDYYRSRNDPFTGSGIINRLQGGIGLFGASVVIAARTLDVTQKPVDPSLEGDYEVAQAPAMTKPYVDVLRLYVETPGTAFASLSGWYSRDRKLTARDGIAGARDGARIELKFLVNQDSRQRLATFVGTQVADSLVGAYVNVAGRVVFRRRAVP